jgi:uncharacterized protein YdeI (YjbR/CyaY-like superfamily)
MKDREILRFADAAAWETWLAKNHDKCDGMYLAIAKKESGERSVTHQEALDVALCYGWIDGVRNSLDEKRFLQSFGPRRARSLWSIINRDKVAALTAAGRMKPPGQAEVDRAKADGRWAAAYAGQKTIQVPDDLAAALQKSAKAKAAFATLSSQNRFAIIFRLGNVKKAETRARKLADYIAMLERGETLHPQGEAKVAAKKVPAAKKAAPAPSESAKPARAKGPKKRARK